MTVTSVNSRTVSEPAESPEERNLAVWEALQETDPNFTKNFNRGGYKGTSINPTYCYKKLTSVFGPNGHGWYVDEVKSEIINSPHTKEVLIFKQVHLFVKFDGQWSKPILGHGGDFIVVCNKAGTPQEYFKADDEAHKKCFTDALTNAMKMLGMSGDVHMGEYDDNKYINELKKKYAEQPPAPTTDDNLHGATGEPIGPFNGDGEARKQWLESAAKYIASITTEPALTQWGKVNGKYVDGLGVKQRAWLNDIIATQRTKLSAPPKPEDEFLG